MDKGPKYLSPDGASKWKQEGDILRPFAAGVTLHPTDPRISIHLIDFEVWLGKTIGGN